MMSRQVSLVGRLLKKSRRVLFITGAGVSAESGIPTFRGSTTAFANGLTEDGIPFEDALASATFHENPQLSWKYFRKLELALRGKLPNIAHHAIAGMESPDRWICVATQNIDGLHQNAGSTSVIEIHGNLRRLLCERCDRRSDFKSFEALAAVPRCRKCSGIMRPDAVLYGEMLPEAALLALDCEQAKGFDLVFSVGTTSVFDYVSQPTVIAAQRGIPTVEINPERTPVSDLVQFRFPATAGPVLHALQELA